MRYIGGVDVGSTQTKAVIIDEDGQVVGRALLDMETSMVTIAQDAFRAALANAGLQEEQVVRIASTGYGRYNVSFGHQQVPADELPACLPSLDYMLEALPFQEVISLMLHGSADCAKVTWTLFGMSIPEWSLLAFIGMILFAVYLLLRRR